MKAYKEAMKERREKELEEVIRPFAVKHNIEDANALHDLYSCLKNLSEYGSEVKFEKNRISVAEGHESWTETKKLLQVAWKAAAKLDKCITQLEKNGLAMGVIAECDKRGQYIEASSLIPELLYIFAGTKNIESVGGHPRRKDWTRQAVQLCKEFWRKHKNIEPTVYFDDKNPEKPKNEFTIWFCDIMYLIAEFRRTQCKTFLED